MLPLTSRHRERIVDREVMRLELGNASRRRADADGAVQAVVRPRPLPAGRAA
jgi:hypothetical protein